MGLYNENFLDALALVSFIVGIANYEENLTQSDKDDLIQKLDRQTKEILENIQTEVEKQNEMLNTLITFADANRIRMEEILERLGDKK